MVDLESYYGKLPITLQHLTCSLEGWRIRRRRYGGDFSALLRGAESRTFWPEDRIHDFRDRRIQAFVQHCARTVPYYKRRFRELGLRPDAVRSLEDLRRLPVLTKEEVQEHYTELISEAVPAREQMITHTSGTTGGGLRFATTLASVQEQWAVWWRFRRWHGIQPDTWCGYFGGRSVVPASQVKEPFWRYNYPGKQILFSAYHMSPLNLPSYVRELRRRRPPWLHGYPSLVALLAGYILESGDALGYQVRWITLGAENLLRQQAEVIRRAFGVSPLQHYGMAEAVANISACELGGLHVDEDFAAVEFVANPDGPGSKVIGSNFTNPATPLLRYDVQDLVTASEQRCSCGRPGRCVVSVDGRLEDYVILKSGARIGRMDHILKDLVNIREAQIHQDQAGEFTIRVVRRANYTAADEASLMQEAHKRVGDATSIRIEYVEKLERSGVGKLRFVVSRIPEGQIRVSRS